MTQQKLKWRGPSYGGAVIEPLEVLGMDKEEEKKPSPSKAISQPPKRESTLHMPRSGQGNQSEMLKSRGDRLMGLGRYEEASEVYSLAVRQEPRSAVLVSNRIAALLRCNRNLSALAEARRLVVMAPGWVKAYGRLVAALHACGEYGEAERQAKAALELFPASNVLQEGAQRAASSAAAQRLVYVRYDNNTLKLRVKPNKSCSHLVTEVVKWLKNQGRKAPVLEDAYLECGVDPYDYIPLAMQIGDVVQNGTHLVIKTWKQAVHQRKARQNTMEVAHKLNGTPDSISRLLEAARFALGLSNWDAAVEAASRVVDTTPQAVPLMLKALAGQRDWQGVVTIGDKYGVDEDNPVYRRALAYVGCADGPLPEVQDDPEHPLARAALAQQLLDQGSYREAANEASIALALSTSTRPLLTRAKAQLALGLKEHALTDLLDYVDSHKLKAGPDYVEANTIVATRLVGVAALPKQRDKLDWTGFRWREWANLQAPVPDATRDADFDMPDTVAYVNPTKVSDDLYAVLGIPHTARRAQIRQAYRAKALQLHPDKTSDKDSKRAQNDFQRVHDAYVILSDPVDRAHYDALRAA